MQTNNNIIIMIDWDDSVHNDVINHTYDICELLIKNRSENDL